MILVRDDQGHMQGCIVPQMGTIGRMPYETAQAAQAMAALALALAVGGLSR